MCARDTALSCGIRISIIRVMKNFFGSSAPSTNAGIDVEFRMFLCSFSIHINIFLSFRVPNRHRIYCDRLLEQGEF